MSIAELGRWIAEQQDAEMARRNEHCDDIETVRLDLFSTDFNEGTAGRRKRFRMTSAVGFSIAAAAALFLMWGVPRVYDGTPATSESVVVETDGKWVASPRDTGRVLSFEDDSSVVLDSGANARVLSQGLHRVHFLLEKGTAHVHVQPRSETRWTIDVGPYTVTVVGTVFQVTWDPDAFFFELSIDEGMVDVSGPMIPDGRRIRHREMLSAWVREGRMEILSPSYPDGASDSESSSRDMSERSAEAREDDMKPPAPKAIRSERFVESSRSSGESWAELNRRGLFSKVLEEARTQDISRVLALRSSSDLMALADAARLTKQWKIAFDTYTVIRSRFSGTEASSVAAYTIGRMYFDQQGNYSEASRWLEIYLSEVTTGNLHREALGRLVEALQNNGDLERARRVALQYLERYPRGPHAVLATDIVGLPVR